MNECGSRLREMVDGQISELIAIVASLEETESRRPCPGREKLGDGTVAACASHTAETYHRIAGFRAGHSADRRDHVYGAQNADVHALLERLSTARTSLSVLANLTDKQHDAVPPATGIRFTDGQRTLEQVVTSMLKHQTHQIDALKAALAQRTHPTC
jgi:homoserine dehydrogenase